MSEPRSAQLGVLQGQIPQVSLAEGAQLSGLCEARHSCCRLLRALCCQSMALPCQPDPGVPELLLTAELLCQELLLCL